jgi:hypothetical protein
MSCHDFEKLVALDVEGDLDVVEGRRLEAHLERCLACRQLAEELKQSQSAFKSIKQDLPDEAALLSIRTRVLADVGDMQSDSWFGRIFINGFRQRVTLAAVALLTIAGWVLWHSQPAHSPAVTPSAPVAMNHPPVMDPDPEAVAVAPLPTPVRKPRVRLPKSVPAPLPAASTVIPEEPQAQVTIRLLTDDPTVIIYWLGDEKGD